MKYLNHDEEIRTLSTRKDLQEYLEFRKEHDEWVMPFINELAAVGIPNEPLFIPQYCSNIVVQKNGFKLEIGDIDVDNADNQECINDTGLFLVFPYQTGLTKYPTRRIAYPSICKRADDDCGVMFRFDVKPNKGILPINEKAERLTRDFQLYSDSCKILLRDDKVSAVLSKEYAIMPADKVVEKLEAQLKVDHPNFTYDKGMVSHEYLVAEYVLNDREMEETFRLRLNDAGADITELKAGVRFSTSDVGLSKVSATLFYDADGVRTTLGTGIFVEHKGNVTPEDFGKKCESLGMLFKECEERIEELGNMDINHVAAVVKAVREVYTFLPKSVSETVESELEIRFPRGGTGIDVYLALNDIVQRHAQQAELSPTRYLNMSEQVAKLMKLPFDKIDAGEDWKKI